MPTNMVPSREEMNRRERDAIGELAEFFRSHLANRQIGQLASLQVEGKQFDVVFALAELFVRNRVAVGEIVKGNRLRM